MRRSASLLCLCLCLGCACWSLTAASADADVTIGADVDQVTTESGTCGFEEASERPCTIVTNAVPGQTMTSPCDGTVTRFRLNGFPRPANHYSLRVVQRNADGSYTGTATSAEVQIESEGVNEYPTSLPIAAGERIGIDFRDSTEEHGLRWAGGSGVSAAVLFDFPADGTAAFPDIPSTNFHYLFNANVACASPPPAPPALSPAPLVPIAPPSNEFHVVSLKKANLTLNLASAGSVTVKEAGKAGGKGSPRLLRPTSASGGPGRLKLKLSLSGAAKAKLHEAGKLKVRASLSFTPTGGTTAVQVRRLKLKK